MNRIVREQKKEYKNLLLKKYRLEKLIANILNEGYSKLKQIVKENVKDILSDNKILMSTAFVALIQTLKADPEMVKLIHYIPATNDDEQHKDINNNTIEYFEVNKDRILDLTKKNYENLVEELTNKSIANASSNPKPALQPSSSIFQNPSDQSDIYQKEESEIYDNSKGDIAD